MTIYEYLLLFQAKHNVCIVYVEQNKLFKAEECLAEVQKLAPKEDYIKRHLEIVRGRIDRQKKMKVNKVNQNL